MPFELSVADLAWEAGALVAARAAYLHAGRSFHAMFQLAWIDLAGGPLAGRRIAAVCRAAPTRAWHALLAVRAAAAAQGAILDGTLASWDIDALRALAHGRHTTARWWASRAAAAHAAGQFGLARACFDEAANHRHYRAPAQYAETLAAAAHLLGALRRT